MNRKKIYIIPIGILLFAFHLDAVVPKKWELRHQEDFLQGKLEGVSVSSDGLLTLAPREDKLEGPAEDFYLSFISAPDGTAFIGTGHGGKVYRLTKEGKFELYFQAPEMDVTCLVLDSRGGLYAGTSPNGKIYKVTGKNQGDVFFNPGEKYIWDLEFDEAGFLLAAVGESGGIYRISLTGEGHLLLKAEENHILCLEREGKKGLLAGSGGVGVVYRVSPEGRASVLFESPYEEVRSLAVDEEGRIYIAACGTPSRMKKEEPAAARPKVSTEVTVTVSPAPPAAPSLPPSAVSPREPGAVFRLSPDGLAKKLWESSDELVYSLHRDEEGKKLLFGTGPRGRVYAIDRDEKTSLLLEGSSEQMYALLPVERKIYALSNNPARLSVISPELRFSGEYTSTVLDTRTVSTWGKIEFEGSVPAGTTLQLQTRTGNAFEPNSTWSDWSPPYQKKEEQILSPRARYLQFRILFKTPSGQASPALTRVSLYYLQANLAPVIKKLELLPPNEVYLKPPDQEEVIWGLSGAERRETGMKEEMKSPLLAKKVERKGYQTAVWEAEDENDDALVYSVFIRKEGEPRWRVLKEEWTDSLLTFDTLSFPDGVYFIKVEASDFLSNPPGSGLKGEKTSLPLVIDNSLPEIKNFTAQKKGNSLEVSFEVEDAFSAIEKAEYLIRPAAWQVVFPVDGLSDSRQETFKFTVPLPANADNLVTVRVFDRHGNVGVFRQTF